jgi:peptidoglycan/LPS O-acetylase OafA/YrhL
LTYIKGLNGLRALSAFLVIGFHLGIRGFSLGWSGVFLFFVLSGFLITRILIHDRGEENFFARFYFRRALRVFPIYYLLFAVVVLAALVRRWPLSDWPWFAFYLQNWKLGQTAFNPVFPPFLNHTWTLAIEEQFYFVWPLLVFVCSRRMLPLAIAALIVLGPATRAAIILFGHNPYEAFTSSLGAVDFLAWGAAAVLIPRGRWTTIGANIALAVLASGAWAIVTIHGINNFWHPEDYLTGLWSGIVFPDLLGPVFAALLLAVSASGGLVVRFLEWAPLRYLGRVSYGLYLYHWPIVLIVPHFVGNHLGQCSAAVPLTIAVAIASFELVERPLLAYRAVILRKPIPQTHQAPAGP